MDSKSTHITKRESPKSHEVALGLSPFFRFDVCLRSLWSLGERPLFNSSYYQYPRIPVCMRISASK